MIRQPNLLKTYNNLQTSAKKAISGVHTITYDSTNAYVDDARAPQSNFMSRNASTADKQMINKDANRSTKFLHGFGGDASNGPTAGGIRP